jgi:hypothetical protein
MTDDLTQTILAALGGLEIGQEGLRSDLRKRMDGTRIANGGPDEMCGLGEMIMTMRQVRSCARGPTSSNSAAARRPIH